MADRNCLFCRIVAGELPAEIVYSDERCIAFRDINPQAPTHLLIVPREHTESLDTAAARDDIPLGHLLRTASRLARENNLAEDGYRTVINTGAGAGQSVLHLHLHVLGGRHFSWPPG
jgi:histidine triad (HIT) family protein